MNNGFYAIYYTGMAGSGFGLIALLDGTIIGADEAGGKYDGVYEIKGSSLEGSLELQVPAGTALVTGVYGQSGGICMNIPLKLPLDLGSGKPIAVQTPTGPVNVIFKPLRKIEGRIA